MHTSVGVNNLFGQFWETNATRYPLGEDQDSWKNGQ